MSKVSAAPRCTPPIPPVANTLMPAMAAMIMVVATVQAPSSLRATSRARSRREALATDRPMAPRCSISLADNPALRRPPRTAMVAGTAPQARMAASTRSAVSTFCGYGMPWEMMVLSNATTGLPTASAAATSGATSRCAFSDGCPWVPASSMSCRILSWLMLSRKERPWPS